MEERYIASVDLGSSKIALTVARISGNDVQIVYYKETPSDGIRNSYVFNPKKASAPLKEAIAEAEKDLRIKILQVVVGLPKYYVKQESASGKVPRGEEAGCITEEEVENLKEMALESYPLNDEKNEVMYGAVAQSFSTEDSFQQVEGDIVGMVSDYLEGNFKVFIGRRRSVANLDVVMNELGIAIARKYFLPDVVAKAVLTEEEMENGVALIDMGAGSTSVTIYKGKVMRHYGAIPFGGKTITSDIRTECGLSERLAENIKLAYGACMPDRLQNLSEKIIQINDENGVPLKQLPVKYLSEIITLREKEIIDSMLYLSQLCDGAFRLPRPDRLSAPPLLGIGLHRCVRDGGHSRRGHGPGGQERPAAQLPGRAHPSARAGTGARSRAASRGRSGGCPLPPGRGGTGRNPGSKTRAGGAEAPA